MSEASLSEWLMVSGAVVCLLAAVGVLRMPDVYTRIQAAAKGGTLGLGLLAAATATHFGDLASWTTAVLLMVFIAMTSPVAAHLIARAAHRLGIEPLVALNAEGDLGNQARRDDSWIG